MIVLNFDANLAGIEDLDIAIVDLVQHLLARLLAIIAALLEHTFDKQLAIHLTKDAALQSQHLNAHLSQLGHIVVRQLMNVTVA